MTSKAGLSNNIRQYENILKSVLVFMVSLLMAGCGESQQSPVESEQTLRRVSIAVSSTPLSAPFFIAEANGYFGQQGLDVNIMDTIGGHRCLVKVLDGEAEMGTSSDYPVMKQSFERNDFVIAATFVSSENDVKLIGSKQFGVNKPADLRNKKVGTAMGSSSHYFLDRFLLFNNMSLSDVNVVHVNPEDQPAALKNGDVDALSVWEPYAYIAKNNLQEDAVIFPAGEYYRETFNLVMKKEFFSSNASTVKKMLKALDMAIEFIRQEPDKAQQILVTRLKLDNAFIDWIWKDYEFALTLDQSLLVTLENEARWALDNGVVNRSGGINFLDYVDVSILSEIDNAKISIIQ